MSGPASCMAAAELIPWLANGTLPAAQATELQSHLDGCSACRQDFESQQRVCAAMRAPDSLVFAAEPSFQKLLDRLDSAEPARAGTPGAVPHAHEPAAPAARHARAVSARRRLTPRLARWLTAAVVVQAIGLGTGMWLWHTRGPAERTGAYVTLAAPAAPWSGERVRVLFRPQVSLDELARLLRGIDARVIDGPTEANVYTLGFRGAAAAAAQRDARLAALRASPAVLFAEPVARDAE